METPYANRHSKDIAKTTSASAATGPVKTTSRHPNESSELDTSRQIFSGMIVTGDSLWATSRTATSPRSAHFHQYHSHYG
jgi:hypothetical protein